MSQITWDDFQKLEIRVGTIIEAEDKNNLKKPSIVLKIDFGKEIGIKKSSARLRKNYSAKQLINKQIAAVINFQPKQIGNLISEVLVLGFPDVNNEPVLVVPELKVKNGKRLF